MLSLRPAFYAALTVGTFTAGVASATTFTFDQVGPEVPSVTFVEDGITLDVTAAQCDPLFGNCLTAAVTQEADGLGVRGALDGGPLGDSDIDSLPGDEYLIFTFDTLVELETVVFGDFNQPGDDNDEYELFILVNGIYTQIVFEGTDNPLNFGPGVVTDSFVVGAVNSDLVTDFRDGFRVASVSLSAIPLPASGLLLLAGFGGLAALRRRKAAA